MGQKLELRTVAEILQQEIDFHKHGAPKLDKPDPKYCEGFINGLEQAKELIAKVAEVEKTER